MSILYDADFYAWTQEQAKLLRQQKWESVDIANLIEEIETLGRQERRELKNRLGILLGHLLKWQYQPELRGNSWLATIREQRREVETLLQADSDAGDFIAQPVFHEAASLLTIDADAPLQTGQKLGHYEIVSRLGAGGMGEVYLAKDSRLNRSVALKRRVLSACGGASPPAAGRGREA